MPLKRTIFIDDLPGYLQATIRCFRHLILTYLMMIPESPTISSCFGLEFKCTYQQQPAGRSWMYSSRQIQMHPHNHQDPTSITSAHIKHHLISILTTFFNAARCLIISIFSSPYWTPCTYPISSLVKYTKTFKLLDYQGKEYCLRTIKFGWLTHSVRRSPGSIALTRIFGP